jgi:carbonic anhydrase
LIVLGHARCGGVAAALAERPKDAIFLQNWVALLDAAKAKAGEATQSAVEYASIRVSLDRLMTFPFVAEAVAAGQLQLSGALFSIFDGRLDVLDRQSGDFRAVS